MLKLFSGFFLLILTLLNCLFLAYAYGLKTYKVYQELPPIYKYILLESKIKQDYEDLKGQNVLVEKWSNRILRIDHYNISWNSIISGLVITKEKPTGLKFQNETIKDLVKNNPNIVSITIEKLGTKKMYDFQVLTLSDIQKAVTPGSSIEGDFPNIY